MARRRGVFVAAAAAGLSGIMLFCFEVVQPSIVRGASMVPALHDGERIFVERLTGCFGSLLRGDVIVLEPPGSDGERYVKRIVALPGDVVRGESGLLFVNGERVLTDLGDNDIYQIVVPADHYFVVGDNYHHSFDSRRFGAVPQSRVIGRVIGKS